MGEARGLGLTAAISRLSDQQALWAVDTVGRTIAGLRGQMPSLMARRVRAVDGLDAGAVPEIANGRVLGGAEAEQRAGRVARHALEAGLNDPREEVRRAIEAAVAEASEPGVPQELVTALLIGGTFLLGLAILAKLEVTKEGDVVLHPGLPDIDKAGEAIGKLVKAAIGA